MQLQEDPIVNSIYTCLFILYIEDQSIGPLWRRVSIVRQIDTVRSIDRTTDCTVRLTVTGEYTGKVVVAEKCDYHQEEDVR